MPLCIPLKYVLQAFIGTKPWEFTFHMGQD